MSFMIIFWPSFQAYFARLLLIEVNKQISHPIITLPKKIGFGVLMVHVQQLPLTGLIQWGNDGTYIITK